MVKRTDLDNEMRQHALYAFLVTRGNKWTSMEQTTDSIKEYPAFFTGVYHNSTARRLLTADIEAINSSDAYEKIIVSGANGIKLATETEFDRFIRAEFKEIFQKLKRVRKLMSKANRDQQIDIDENVFDAFVDAWIDSENE